jgi:Holliday junction resolvasome RuvABC endonuclease subunit
LRRQPEASVLPFLKGRRSSSIGAIAKVEEMIVHYQPDAIVLEDHLAKHSRRSARIQALSRRIIAVAKSRNVTVTLFSREQVRRAFFADGQGTKYALAEILAVRFTKELNFRLPPKRRPWMSEDYRMDIFDAVALALVLKRSTLAKNDERRSTDRLKSMEI